MSVVDDVQNVMARISAIDPAAAAAAPAFGDAAAGAADAGRFSAYITAAAAREHLPAGLVRAIAETESGMNPAATSPAGAEGIMQLMPDTASTLGVSDPYDPQQSIDGGAHYLRELLDRFGGNVPLAVAAYNAGPGAVERYGGIPPYAETQSYVRSVLGKLPAG